MPRLASLLAAAALYAADFAAEGRHWWSHIQFLASDDLEGRNTGSAGHRKAAAYVAQEFERAGLKAAGTSGYLQPVKFDVRQIVEDKSSLSLIRGGKEEPLKLGQDATIGVRNALTSSVEAPAVFAGHGLVIPEASFDDLAGLDVRGKIVVYLTGGPPWVASPVKAHYSSRGERWKAFQKAGAIGTAEIQNPRSMDIPWARSSLARLNPAMGLSDPALQEITGLRFSIQINAEHAEKVFASSGHTFAEVLALANDRKPLPHFPLNLSFRAKVAFQESKAESPNVVALYPGNDTKLKEEYVVLTAHLDHLGVGQPINGDKIYNGAMDDGSGIATLLEVARLLKESGARTKRSLLLIAVTGEEKGLAGSRHFAHYPTVKKENIVADINIDMFLPLFPLKYLEVQGVDESTLGAHVRAAAQAAGVEIQTDKEPDRVLFIRSDQYSFIRQGVPALAFKFGYLKGSPEEKINKEWYKSRYHAPSDDLTQPVDLEGAARFNRIILDLAQRVANAADRPHWNESSFFRRFATAR